MKKDGAVKIAKIDDQQGSIKYMGKEQARSAPSVTGKPGHHGSSALVIEQGGGQRNVIIGIGGFLTP